MFVAGLFRSLKMYSGNRRTSVGVLKGAVRGLLLAIGLLSMQQEVASAVTVWPNISLIRLSSGLASPIHITHSGDKSGRLFVVEQSGRIRMIRADKLLATPFLDISDRVLSGGERGLLSVAFPPGFASSGNFYVDYTRQPDGATVIARYNVSSDPDIADHLSEEVLLVISQPFANHNGGQLAFGPDGYLYIGTGDGGSGGDPLNNAQNQGSLLGKLLRIDVESIVSPYAVPSTNPFVLFPWYRPEIWAVGLRNPWRFSFDRITGDLYIGDVGQNLFEEVNFQPASSVGGENYGWNIMEASHCYQSSSCSSAGLVLPVSEYDHTSGDCSVTAGMIYRGSKYPGMQGVYIYGDYCSGRMRGLRNFGELSLGTVLLDSAFNISTFGEDESANLYLADYASGTIYRVIDTLSAVPVPTGQKTFVFQASDSPVVSHDTALLNPFGLGPLATGGNMLQLQVALPQFAAPVDLYVYIAYSASDNPANIFLLRPDLSPQAFSSQDAWKVLSGMPVAGLEPWMGNVNSPVDVNPLTLSVADLMPGTYVLYLLVTPAGRLDAYYLGETSFVIP